MSIEREVVHEMAYGLQKFGKYSSPHEAMAVIREEYLEMERAVFHGTPEQARKEAIQLSAVAMRFAMEFRPGNAASGQPRGGLSDV